MRVSTSPRLAMLAVAALLASACGGSSSNEAPPVVASFSASPSTVAPGGTATLSWTVTGATSITIDQGVGTVTGTSVQVTPDGTQAYTLTATNAVGSTPSSPVTVTVVVGPPVLEVACAGAECGATSPVRFSGSKIGIWRYHNGTAEPQTIDVAIEIGAAGATQELEPLLLFSNGSAQAATAPAPLGTFDLPAGQDALRSDAERALDARDQASWEASERNLRTALAFRDLVPDERTGLASALATPPPAPVAVGDTRTWLDMAELRKPTDPRVVRENPSTARRVCTLSTGRKAVFWVADDAWDVTVKAADLDVFEPMVCGPGKGYAQLAEMIGDAWGDEANRYPYHVIQDAPVRQNVHIVFARLIDPNFAGYFWSCNNQLKGHTASNCPDTNEALVVFVNATNEDQSWTASTVLHELTHLANFYQRSFLTRSPYDTWLEEMSAMMTEDIVVPAVAPADFTPTTPARVEAYVKNGGAVSLMGWDGGNSYNLGATFGAFLSRRFGTDIYTGMKSCPREWSSTSYSCLEGLIQESGGVSLADEFARVGASVYGLLPEPGAIGKVGAPDGYGMPARKISDTYSLRAIDISAYASSRPGVAKPLPAPVPPANPLLPFLATTQTYKIDEVRAGGTLYWRPGVVVPANTTLMVVIKP